MIYYFPSCQFQAAHPETSARIKTYLKQRWNADIVGCCRSSWSIQDEDLLITVCLSCQAILQEHFPNCTVIHVLSLFERDSEFFWPDYKGVSITVQDCVRASLQLRCQVRQALRKMNFIIHEPQVQAAACGTLLMNPISERNLISAPYYFEELKKSVTLIPLQKQLTLLQSQADAYPDRRIVTYCNSCYKAMTPFDIINMHLLDLIFNPHAE